MTAVRPADLTAATRELERGNCPVLTPAALQRLAGPSEETARLAAIQLDVATSMRCQALGAVTRSDEPSRRQAKALPPAFRHSVRAGGSPYCPLVHGTTCSYPCWSGEQRE